MTKQRIIDIFTLFLRLVGAGVAVVSLLQWSILWFIGITTGLNDEFSNAAIRAMAPSIIIGLVIIMSARISVRILAWDVD